VNKAINIGRQFFMAKSSVKFSEYSYFYFFVPNLLQPLQRLCPHLSRTASAGQMLGARLLSSTGMDF